MASAIRSEPERVSLIASPNCLIRSFIAAKSRGDSLKGLPLVTFALNEMLKRVIGVQSLYFFGVVVVARVVGPSLLASDWLLESVL
jgi:hypothetical protein